MFTHCNTGMWGGKGIVQQMQSQTSVVCAELLYLSSLPLTFFGTTCKVVYAPCRAVSLSPRALLLLDAEDRRCLLAASRQSSMEVASASWNPGLMLQEMLASFREKRGALTR
jgi:hypothetical protein